MIVDEFLTVVDNSEGLYREKGSKFIAYLMPLEHESHLDSKLLRVKKLHPKARHHCFAYKIGLEESKIRVNDDGEPSGTAGLPIIGQIRSAELTNVIIIVVRYFGGTKLGAAGLIRAYKTSAEDAIANGTIVRKYLTSTIFLTTTYQKYPHLLDALKRTGLRFKNPIFNDKDVRLAVEVRLSRIESSLANVLSILLHRNPDEIEDIYSHSEVLKIES